MPIVKLTQRGAAPPHRGRSLLSAFVLFFWTVVKIDDSKRAACDENPGKTTLPRAPCDAALCGPYVYHFARSSLATALSKANEELQLLLAH